MLLCKCSKLFRHFDSNYLYISGNGPEGNLSTQYWPCLINAVAGKTQSMRQRTRGPVVNTSEELVISPDFSTNVHYCFAFVQCTWISKDVYVTGRVNVPLVLTSY